MSRHGTVATLVFTIGLALGLRVQAAEVPVRGDQCGYTSNQLASSLTRSVMWSLFTGQASELEARAGSVDRSMEKEMKARSGQLEARARAICPRLAELDDLQQQFRFRLAGGQPLQLLTDNRDRKGKDSQSSAAGDEVAQR